MISILLFEDLAIVPLLALVAFLAPGSDGDEPFQRAGRCRHRHASIVGLVVAGRYLLNPLFRILADSGPAKS